MVVIQTYSIGIRNFIFTFGLLCIRISFEFRISRILFSCLFSKREQNFVLAENWKKTKMFSEFASVQRKDVFFTTYIAYFFFAFHFVLKNQKRNKQTKNKKKKTIFFLPIFASKFCCTYFLDVILIRDKLLKIGA